MPVPGERLALADDTRLGFKREQDQATIDRHLDRYHQAVHAVRTLYGSGGTWLDLGCGTGYGAEVLGRWADDYVGVDISERAIEYARHHHAGDRRRWIWASHRTWPLVMERSPAPHGQAMPDVVVCIEAFEHLCRAEQAVLLYRVARYMNPHGLLVLMCPLGEGLNPGNPYHLNEPSMGELTEAMGRSFRYYDVQQLPPYSSTAGQQVTQALALGSKWLPIG